MVTGGTAQEKFISKVALLAVIFSFAYFQLRETSVNQQSASEKIEREEKKGRTSFQTSIRGTMSN